MELFIQGKGKVKLGRADFVAQGGEASVYARGDLAFKVYTDPEMLPRWWGPRYLTTTVDKMDVRPGGQWRFVQRTPDGREYGFHGVYHDVAGPERVVDTFEFEGMPGHVALETTTLEDLGGGRTLLTTHSVFQSVADRDAAANSGRESCDGP